MGKLKPNEMCDLWKFLKFPWSLGFLLLILIGRPQKSRAFLITQGSQKMSEGQQGDDRLLRIEDVGNRLGLSPQTVRRMANAGSIPPGLKLGRARRWRPQDLVVMLQQFKPAK